MQVCSTAVPMLAEIVRIVRSSFTVVAIQVNCAAIFAVLRS